MDHYEELFQSVVDIIEHQSPAGTIKQANKTRIPLGISNRHIHLAQKELEVLFGLGYVLNKQKDLSQPGQYAAKETVLICGPKGCIERVRVLGPVRPETQVEILASDCYKLGVKTDYRLSGDLAGTPGITIVGPKGSVQLASGLIIAQRHIHVTPADAAYFEVYDQQNVSIGIEGTRGGILNNVIIRVSEKASLECHIDTDEANGVGATANTVVTLIK